MYVLVLSIVIEFSLSTAQCRIEYYLQPLSTTLSDCNPFHDNRIVISLECGVKRWNGVTDQFKIKWFRENSSGTVVNLGRGYPEFNKTSISRHHDMDFINQQYDPSFLGKYWCQVINTTADPDQPLKRSNVFTLLAPENYTGSRCSSVQQVRISTCADLPARSVQTTLQVSITDCDTSVTQMIFIQGLNTVNEQ